MGMYLKLDYKTSKTNKALEEAITYIGRYNGKYAYKVDVKKSEYLKGGIKYIAKKFGRFRINAIKTMIYAKSIKGTGNKRWCFNKQTYVKAYRLIVEILLKCQGGNRQEVISMLERLYNDTKGSDSQIERVCSDALIYWQKKMLNVNALHENADVAVAAEKIYNGIVKNDKQIPKE